ncbi:MAG: YitT family protein [Limnohabitans sp.]
MEPQTQELQFNQQSSHSVMEDVQAVLAGTLLVAIAILFFRQSGLITGGTTGLALLIHYPTGWRYGTVMFVINLPFYVFGYKALGPWFTAKTFVSVGLLSLWVEVIPQWFTIAQIDPIFGAVAGGVLAGTGILILIRHVASLGGISILAIYLQKTRNWRAGAVQMGFDTAILAIGFWVLEAPQVIVSMVGALALNAVIAVNHRKGRYFTV